MGNKKVYVDDRAIREIQKLSPYFQEKIRLCLNALNSRGRIDPPDAKRINKDLCEFRIQRDICIRGLYAYIPNNKIILLKVFIKKSQKTPLKHIRTATHRLKNYT